MFQLGAVIILKFILSHTSCAHILLQFDFLGPPSTDDWPVSLRRLIQNILLGCKMLTRISLYFLQIHHRTQELKELPLLKNGEVEIPKRWHMKNNGRHMLDIFRNWKCPHGIKLLMGLLKYNPAKRWTAEEALGADYFSTLVGFLWSIVYE